MTFESRSLRSGKNKVGEAGKDDLAIKHGEDLGGIIRRCGF
jgi:hypothetical protein